MLFNRNLKTELPKAVYTEGIYLHDEKGNKYLDAGGNACAISIGHNNQYVREKLEDQLKKISFAHTATFNSESAEKLSSLLTELLPENLKYAFFACNGSDVVESAIKLAFQYHKEKGSELKRFVFGKNISYHGNTINCLMISGNQKRRTFYENLLRQGSNLKLNHIDCYRTKDIDKKVREELKKFEESVKQTAQFSTSLIIEPVSGASGGACVSPKKYLEGLYEICKKQDILFIADEVMTGVGRTGKNWGFEHFDIVPDIVLTAKGLSNGVLPLSALVCSKEIHETIKKGSGELMNGFTWHNHPMSCAVGTAVLEYMKKNNLVNNCSTVGDYLIEQMKKKLYNHPFVGDIRGKGLFLGMEFVKDKTTKEPFQKELKFAYKIKQKCMQNGLLIYPSQGCIDGYQGDTILVAPPYIITKNDADKIVELLDRSFKEVKI